MLNVRKEGGEAVIGGSFDLCEQFLFKMTTFSWAKNMDQIRSVLPPPSPLPFGKIISLLSQSFLTTLSTFINQ